MKSGTIFDNVLVTDDVEFAKKEIERVKEVVVSTYFSDFLGITSYLC